MNLTQTHSFPKDPMIADLVRSIREEELYQSNNLTHREGYLLRRITLAYLNHQRIRTSELTKDRSLGSAPTIAAAIRMLVEKGLIKKEVDPVDQRNQWLIPTEHALELFSALSQIGINETKVNGG